MNVARALEDEGSGKCRKCTVSLPILTPKRLSAKLKVFRLWFSPSTASTSTPKSQLKHLVNRWPERSSVYNDSLHREGPILMVDRLPYEIFKEIIQTSNPFVSSRRRSKNDPIPDDLDGLSLPPITASHVCRSWRMALQSDPTMWTCLRIPQMKPAVVKEMLRLSGTAPLNVFINPLPYSPCLNVEEANVITTIFRLEMHRLRGLQITDVSNGPGRQWVFIVMPYLKHPAPELQKLYLNVLPASEDFFRTLFSGNAPKLSHVSQRLSGTQTLLCCPSFKGLSSLHFELTDNTTIRCDTLLDILQLSPQLRTFGLNFSSPTLLIVPPTSDDIIHLPCLQQLSLWGYFKIDMINHVLEHLVFPLENLEYHIQCDNSSSFHSRLLLQLLTQRSFSFLSISWSRNSDASLEFFESHSPQTGAIPPFKTRYSESMDNLPTFLQVFNLSDITHLRIEGGSAKFAVLRDIFFSLVNLQHLCVVPRRRSDPAPPMMTAFLTALQPIPSTYRAQEGLGARLHDDSQPDNSQASATTLLSPCPSLRTLEIIICPSMKLDEPDAETVYICSAERHRAGHPFTHVTIYCMEQSLLEYASEWLEPREEFPVEVLTDVPIDVDDTDFFSMYGLFN